MKITTVMLQDLMITFLIILLILISFIYLLQKQRFFELCEKYCSKIGCEADAGNFGLDCNCIGNQTIFKAFERIKSEGGLI